MQPYPMNAAAGPSTIAAGVAQREIPIATTLNIVSQPFMDRGSNVKQSTMCNMTKKVFIFILFSCIRLIAGTRQSAVRSCHAA